jgi:hypothetical protein
MALVTCMLMLASTLRAGQGFVSEADEADFMSRCCHFAAAHRPGAQPPAPRRTFAMHWEQRCERSWRRAFMLFGAGVPCLFANLAVAGWIKFSGSVPAAAITTVVLLAGLFLMAALHRPWSAHILGSTPTQDLHAYEGSAHNPVRTVQ